MASGIDIMLTALCLNVNCNAQTSDLLPQNMLNSSMINIDALPSDTRDKFLQNLRDDLSGRELMVVSVEDFPLSYRENGVPKGVAFQILSFLSEKFNFTYKVQFSPRDIYFGSPDDMTGSLVDYIKAQKADLAAAFVPIVNDARQLIDYSTTTLDEGEWIMIMKRPGESATGSGLLAPFDRDVWLLILLSFLTVGPIIYILIIIRLKITKDKNQPTYALPHCMWFVYGALMKQGSTLSPVADSTRMLFATWWIFITILTSFYTANLTAFLTLSKFTLPINSIDDIIRNNKHFVSREGGVIEYAIKNRNESLVQLEKMLRNERAKFTTTSDNDTLVTFVEKKDYVFVRDRPAIDHIIKHDYVFRKTIATRSEERQHCPFATSKTPFMRRKRAFAYAKEKQWHYLFDSELLHLVESGIVKYMLLENLPNTEVCPQNLGTQDRQLRNGDLIMTYKIMLAGFCTGGAVFFSEMLFRFLNNRALFKEQFMHRFKKKGFQETTKKNLSSVTPPPAYATLFNQSRNNNIWTTQNLSQKSNNYFNSGTHNQTQYINGRNYMVVKGFDGEKRLIPLRQPSATLFEYSYTK